MNVPISAAQIAQAYSGVSPANQGYHAKINVDVSGSQGADGKSKVIWIQPCASSTSPPSSPPPATSTGAPSGYPDDRVHWRPERLPDATSTGSPGGVTSGSGPDTLATTTASGASTPGAAGTTSPGGAVTPGAVSAGGPALALAVTPLTTG